MNCEETAQAGYIWLRFGASAIKGGQRVKYRAAIYHALCFMSYIQGRAFYFFFIFLTMDYPDVAYLWASYLVVLMSHTCGWSMQKKKKMCTWLLLFVKMQVFD